MPQAATKQTIEPQASGTSVLADLVLGAKLEFYACLQLLAERARFVTGASWAAIALREGERFTYQAAVGEGAPAIGGEAALNPELSGLHPLAKPNEGCLIAGIVHGSSIVAFLELTSTSFDFGDQELQVVSRLSEVVGTAIDHMRAAESSQELLVTSSDAEFADELVIVPGVAAEPTESAPIEPLARTPKPVVLFWHAPEGAQAAAPSVEAEETSLSVRLCQSCGFPVSPGRAVCMDCEERGGRIPPALFGAEKSESWIRSHGYTIASLLVPALAAALIYLFKFSAR